MEKPQFTRIKFTLVELDYLEACILFCRKSKDGPKWDDKSKYAQTAIGLGIDRLEMLENK